MDHHLIDDQEIPRHERELTLSTGSILAIFLGLAVLCGGFFGFGYNMGRKSAPTPLTLSEVTPEPASSTSVIAKPAAGALLDGTPATSATTPAPKPAHRTAAPTTPATTAEADANAEPATKPAATRPGATPPAAAAPIVRQPAPVSPTALNPSAAPATTGTYVVQVAAVSHQDDADLLVGALRARGYAVSTRSSEGDRFIHVQIGPFYEKQQADAMRQRLLTDGYNAIVKQ